MGRSAVAQGLAAAARPPVVAAVIGNAFISRDSVGWLRQLHRPRLQLPVPAFVLVGAIYYLQLGLVLYRAYLNGDRNVRKRALLVLAGNELWNVAFFARRSPRNGFAGTVVFLGPLLALQKSVAPDLPSVLALTPYTLWVTVTTFHGRTDCGGSIQTQGWAAAARGRAASDWHAPRSVRVGGRER